VDVKLQVAIVIEYEVEGEADPAEVGVAAVRHLPDLPKFGVRSLQQDRGWTARPTAVARISETVVEEEGDE